ncbi:hypothetical protein L3X38_011548 [Prunus dulcis]|uniref:Uncharacterized protein n=1 Tax=Prunus dulcis TaxID=3755 RepID=A0AAD4ZEE7_PRUDU|nr:hypothetical protein L3X38_011548 [Prunus dulcis]
MGYLDYINGTAPYYAIGDEDIDTTHLNAYGGDNGVLPVDLLLMVDFRRQVRNWLILLAAITSFDILGVVMAHAQLLELREKEKHRSHSCQLITNGILVKNIVELIKKLNEDELERKRVKGQRSRRFYGGPIRIYMATKDNLRSLRIAVKLGVCAYGRGRNINKLLQYKNLLVQSVKPTPQPESPVEIFDTTTNKEIVVLDPFTVRENNTFMAAVVTRRIRQLPIVFIEYYWSS